VLFGFLSLQYGTVRLSRNVGKELPLLAANGTEDRCCRLLRGGTLKLRVVLIYCAGDKVNNNEMGGACSAYGGRERCVLGFGGET
jgi:hypothetical protein